EQISSEFLDLAKPYLGEEKNINISQVVEDMKELMEPQSVQQGVNIHTEIDHPEIIIGCDEMKIKQVFVNLIKNAIESMDEGMIRIAVNETSTDVYIYIIDDGTGIPDDILTRIGQSF